jgi:hypothetical protein
MKRILKKIESKRKKCQVLCKMNVPKIQGKKIPKIEIKLKSQLHLLKNQEWISNQPFNQQYED